jgi:hypothetical protein
MNAFGGLFLDEFVSFELLISFWAYLDLMDEP